MADTKDILNQLGVANTNLNDMHAIKEAIGGGGGGKYADGSPVKIGTFTNVDVEYNMYKCIIEVGSMPAQVPADIIAHLDIAVLLNIYAVQNSGNSFIDKVTYNYDTRQITMQNTAYWVERIVVEYLVRV